MKEKKSLLGYINYVVAFLVGAVISLMVVFNTKLGQSTTNEVSIFINQIVGIVTLTIIMVIGRKNPTINPVREKSAWWQWFGGLFGLLILTINYYSVSYTGTTIAMAAAVLGQCLMGLVFDITGWMGMSKQKITRRKIVSLLVSLLGIGVMLFWQSSTLSLKVVLFGLLAILSGVLTMIQMVYNSGFSKKKGAFFSARQNVISGLIGIALFMFIFKGSESIEGLKALSSTPLYVILLGGMLACIVVVSTNTIIPKLPGAISSVLLSSGQILMAVALDAFLLGIFEPSLLVGAIIMLVGIFLNL